MSRKAQHKWNTPRPGKVFIVKNIEYQFFVLFFFYISNSTDQLHFKQLALRLIYIYGFVSRRNVSSLYDIYICVFCKIKRVCITFGPVYRNLESLFSLR